MRNVLSAEMSSGCRVWKQDYAAGHAELGEALRPGKNAWERIIMSPWLIWFFGTWVSIRHSMIPVISVSKVHSGYLQNSNPSA